MSNERDDLFEQEAEYEAIFKSLREKYNLDGDPKEEEKPKEFYNPEKDTELNEFFEEKSKMAEEKADEYMYDEEDIIAVEKIAAEDLKVEDFDSESCEETPKTEKEQQPEDLIWDENTMLDFSGADKKEKEDAPTVFEDISSNKTPDEIDDDDSLSLEAIKEYQTISIEETDGEGDEETEQQKQDDLDKTRIVGDDDPAGLILPKLQNDENDPERRFFIKSDAVDEMQAEDDEFEFVSDGDNSDKSDNKEEAAETMKDVTYENINWEDFPTPKEYKKELKKQKKAEKKKGKHGIFPKKGDSAGEVIRKIILIISVLAILGSSGWLANDLVVQPFLANRLYNGIIENIVKTNDNRHVTGFDDMTAQEREQATKELLSQNKEYVGWLTVKGADVSLPVVLANDNYKYLHTGFDGKYLNAGTLFVGASNKSVLDKNVVIYGHNMNNGSMFGLLRKYKESDGSIYRDYPYITFHTVEGSFKYQIYGAFLADGAGKSDNYLVNTAIKPNFSDEAFVNYMTTVKKKAYYETSLTVEPEDKILTLVTCDRSNLKTGRLVVVAKLIEKI